MMATADDPLMVAFIPVAGLMVKVLVALASGCALTTIGKVSEVL